MFVCFLWPQVEKAKAHYNSKKQLLQEALEQVQSLETALESSQRENSHLKTESKQLDMELQQSQLNAKNLTAKVSSLHAQVSGRSFGFEEFRTSSKPGESRKMYFSSKTALSSWFILVVFYLYVVLFFCCVAVK